MEITLSEAEIREITGYRQPHKQLEALHLRGYHRAYRAPRTGRIILERAHYLAVNAGAQPANAPKVRPIKVAA